MTNLYIVIAQTVFVSHSILIENWGLSGLRLGQFAAMGSTIYEDINDPRSA